METIDLSMFDATIKYGGEDIFIQPVCDYFGIDYLNQKKLINRNPLLKSAVSKKTHMLLFGDERDRLALTKRAFITWILQLRCQIVHPSLREKLVLYQQLIFDFMFGSIERIETVRINYARLKKLKSLKAKIGAEINRMEDDVQCFLNERFIQTRLNF